MITSIGNSQIKSVINLIKKSKDRKAQGLFVVEGKRMFSETPKDRIDKVYATEDFYKENSALFEGIQCELVSDAVFEHMSDTKTPQGVLATVKMEKKTIEEIVEASAKSDKAPFFLVLENIQDPGNLGTIIRTSEGAGVMGILMTAGTADIYNPKVIRSTMGAMYRMPFAYGDSIEEIMALLKKKGITTYAAHLRGESFYDEQDYKKGTAFLIGNEGNGLTDTASNLSDVLIKIPMEGNLESLNAAISAAILTYEVHRQRRY